MSFLATSLISQKLNYPFSQVPKGWADLAHFLVSTPGIVYFRT